MSFGAVAEDYDRLRASPPDDAVDWLLPADCRVAVDVGAGTGLLTRALARKVPEVVAVEPDERMAAVLRARAEAAHASGMRVLPGRGEAIPLPDGRADGVFFSSSWHWMDPERTTGEIGRVLRVGGRLGVIWTSRDHSLDWLREVDLLRNPTQGGRRQRVVDLPPALFSPVETAQFTFTRRMAVDDLVAMLATYSGTITASPAEREARLTRARAVLDEHFPGAAEVDVPMRAACFRADRVSQR
jgi:SAM-dependent methyltransferase